MNYLMIVLKASQVLLSWDVFLVHKHKKASRERDLDSN